VIDMMLLSKVEQIGKDDCCPACKMLRSMLFSRGKIMREMLGEGIYIRKGKIYIKTGNFEGNDHTMSNMSFHLSSFANQYFIRENVCFDHQGEGQYKFT